MPYQLTGQPVNNRRHIYSIVPSSEIFSNAFTESMGKIGGNNSMRKQANAAVPDRKPFRQRLSNKKSPPKSLRGTDERKIKERLHRLHGLHTLLQ